MAADRAAQSLPTARPPQATLPTDVDRLFSAYNAQEGRATAANASLILDVATRLTPEQQELAKVSSAVDSAKKAIVSLQTPLRSEETPPIDYAKALESLGKRAEVGYGYTPEQALAYARAVLPIKQGETITADDLDRIAGDIPKGVTSPGQKQQAAELQYQEAKADYFPEGAKARQAVAIPLIAKAAADALGGQDAKKNPRAFASAFFETFGQRWVVDAASKGFPTEYVDRLRYEAMIFVAKHPEFFKDIAPMLTPDRVAAIRDLATGSQGLDAAAGDISAAIGPDATPDDLAKAIAASVAASVAGGVGNVVPR
jgi:hypothetical protein